MSKDQLFWNKWTNQNQQKWFLFGSVQQTFLTLASQIFKVLEILDSLEKHIVIIFLKLA